MTICDMDDCESVAVATFYDIPLCAYHYEPTETISAAYLTRSKNRILPFERFLTEFEFSLDAVALISQTKPTDFPLNDGDCVYIIGLANQPGTFKIGQTNSTRKRIESIATSNPNKPYLVHAFYTSDKNRLERELHRQFAGKRTHGEWFNLSDEDVINAIDAGEALLIGGAQ